MSRSSRRNRPTLPDSSGVGYARDAAQQIEKLHGYFEDKGRIEASRNLDRALDEAEVRIFRNPNAGLPAPRPYPELAHEGEAWIKVGRYWIAYRREKPLVILAVFDETADIPGRY